MRRQSPQRFMPAEHPSGQPEQCHETVETATSRRRAKKDSSETGNRTPVSPVTGANTGHYTISDPDTVIFYEPGQCSHFQKCGKTDASGSMADVRWRQATLFLSSSRQGTGRRHFGIGIRAAAYNHGRSEMTTSNPTCLRAVWALLALFAVLTGPIGASPLRDAGADVHVDSVAVVDRLTQIATTHTQKTIVKTIRDVLAGGGDATFPNDMPWDDEGNVLHWAARQGQISVVESLIRLPGVKVNEHGKSGKTALHFAAFAGHKGIVGLLLTAPGINVNAPDAFRKTPLHAAVASRQPEIVEMLAKRHDADVNARDRDLTTALHWSMTWNNVDVVKVLLNSTGIDVNPKDHHLATPLHWAASLGRDTLVALLVLDPRINVAAVDDAQQTPLHRAVANSRVAVVEILVGVRGIDTSLKDKDGKTALDLARERELRSVERLLGGRGNCLSGIARGMKRYAGWLLELLNRPLTRWR